MPNFPERLKELRTQAGLSQEQVGQIIGVKKYSVYTYEKGKSSPFLQNLIDLADYFDVSIDYLAGRTDNPEVNRRPYRPAEKPSPSQGEGGTAKP